MGDIVGLAWELTSVTGWGVYGTHLALGLARAGSPRPVLLKRPARLELNPDEARVLDPLLAEQARITRQVLAAGRPRVRLPFPVIKTLLPGFVEVSAAKVFQSAEQIGVIFFEDPHLTPEQVDAGQRYRHVVTGSSWNAEVLRSHGLRNVRCIQQGVDTSRFAPAPKAQSDRFVIFSGGKLERRKGQDIVLAAFRRFVARHPEAVLVTAWQNAWPEKITDLPRSGLVEGLPERSGECLDITGWALANGCPPGSVVDLGWVPNSAMPVHLAQADCAVFASRYESGTNLPAMEALAMGIPTVLSANTGHLDLLHGGGCVPLLHQRPVEPPSGMHNDGWGESDPDELLASMEALHGDHTRRMTLSMQAQERRSGLDWSNAVAGYRTLLGSGASTRARVLASSGT